MTIIVIRPFAFGRLTPPVNRECRDKPLHASGINLAPSLLRLMLPLQLKGRRLIQEVLNDAMEHSQILGDLCNYVPSGQLDDC